ncbi:hypothetical protein [Nocardioides sp.]|uniref:hypothetical protein n=1 Tax=Nocardioides sp. TaxID=35761 RepID=UPI0031FEEC9D
MDDVTWGALTFTLTLLGGIWTWYAFRNRGIASGVRGAALTLLPLAAYLTKTLRMFTRIGQAVGDWAASLVFNPFVWIGIVLFVVSGVLFGVSGAMDARGIGGGSRKGRKARKAESQAGAAPALASGEAARNQGRGAPAIDDDMAEIEALLRKRGIS